MFEIVNQYWGVGTFHFVSSKEISLDLNFQITQYSDAKIEINCALIQATLESASKLTDLVNMNTAGEEITVSMNGTTYYYGGKIKVEDAFIDIINFDTKIPIFPPIKLTLRVFKPVEIIYKEIESGDIRVGVGLTNFIFGNCKTGNDEFNGFNVDLKDFSVHFQPTENYNLYSKSLKNSEETILVTSEAFIDSNINSNFTEIINNLSELLSYACRTRISPLYEDYYFEDSIFKTILKPVVTRKFNKKDNLIDSDHFEECSLKYYLEKSYNNYLEFRDKFSLNIVISFYLEAITHDYTDMAFLLGATTLETLLTEYEEIRKEERNPIALGLIKSNKKKITKILKKEEFLIPEEIAEKLSEEISYKNLNIQEKLSALTKDPRFLVKLNEYDRDFSLIRNTISHTGKFPKTINSNGKERNISLRKELNRLIYLIDRIMLTILNYKEKPFISKLDNSIKVLEYNE